MRGIREPVNFYTHAIPALLSVPACVLLLLKSDSTLELAAASVYGICAFTLFFISAVYHSYPVTDYGIRFWQKFDHCCIYLMIAGTYTPTSLLAFNGWTRWALLALIWLIALTGCALKIGNMLMNDKVSLTIYITMGCLIIPLVGKMLMVLPPAAILWLILGGLFYIGGSYFYYKDSPLGKYFHSHELWHLFVVFGAASHFIYTYFYLFKG